MGCKKVSSLHHRASGKLWPWDDRVSVRQVVEGMLNEEQEDVDELADYKAGVPQVQGSV